MSHEYIIEKLNKIYDLYPYLEIQYEYRNYVKTHVVQVKPIHCYEFDKQYIEQQNILQEDFNEQFPYEDLLFITENNLIHIENPILELGCQKTIAQLKVIDPISIDDFLIPISAFEGVYRYMIANANAEIAPYIKNKHTVFLSDTNFIGYEILSGTKEETLKGWRSLIESLKLKKPKEVNENVKKDSEIYSESFFLLLLQHDKSRASYSI